VRAEPSFLFLALRSAFVSEPDFLTSTRSSYDAVAVEYDVHFREALAGRPWDRAVLAVFAELVQRRSPGPVADIGCGTGHQTAFLHSLSVDVFGVDLSPGMLAVARQEHPGIPFTVGSMLALDLADDCLGGLLAYYSTILVPDDPLSTVLAEFARVLGPGGHLLLAFQVGDEPLRLSEAFGHEIALEFHRRRPEYMVELVEAAGLVMRTRLVREPEEDERTAQAYLVARKPTGS
jgi:ubiquinone/menaquinone biosynthesis C-methylase UbiE